jgi:hypothetical protein
MQDGDGGMIGRHIALLLSMDTDEYYSKDEQEVHQYAAESVRALAGIGKAATKDLVVLLATENTWSCFFALKVLREIKDPSAVPFLIEFLKRDSDDTLSNEEAMFALQDIGDPCVTSLIEELTKDFSEKRYNAYLVGALTGIVGPKSYDFMVKTTKEFITAPSKFHGWFSIDDFTFNFITQRRPEVLPLLRQVLTVRSLTSDERHEIADTIEALENPSAYEEKLQKTITDLDESS